MTNTPAPNRLQLLEEKIKSSGLSLYLVPMVDAFQSEYIPASAARLPFLTGFTGSAGMAACWGEVSDAHRHTLFVDGRYILQAPHEVDTAQLDVLNSGEVSLFAWLERFAGETLRIGFDPWLVTVEQVESWRKRSAAYAWEWVAHPVNLVDAIWPDKPPEPAAPVVLHALDYAGTSYADKRAQLLTALAKQKADALVLTLPDAINWLLNIRGGDIPFNPLLLGYFLLKRDGSSVLYTHPRDWSPEVVAYFAEAEVTLAPIAEIFAGTCAALAAPARVMLHAGSAPYGFAALVEAHGLTTVAAEDPTELPKAIKNATELAGIRAAHGRDGLALSRFLCWFDGQVGSGKRVDELGVIAKLEAFRAAEPSYRGPSFATIAGAGPNGAIIHYRADEKTNRVARSGELFLLDSGGQYPGGTTDVTRTLAVGTPTAAMKEHFTRVLKGHIALASARFPRGTSGIQLDVLARQALWAVGLDYDHGTGHGVGAYLCVHEGPQRISKRGSLVALQPGMIISNEPGYYAAGAYGIRIESLVAVVEAELPGMFGFETLTLAPIDTRLVDTALLTSGERNWLNQYHARVYKTHEAALSRAEQEWLAQATRAI